MAGVTPEISSVTNLSKPAPVLKAGVTAGVIQVSLLLQNMSKKIKKRKLKKRVKKVKDVANKTASIEPDMGAFEDLAKARVFIDEMYKIWGTIKDTATELDKMQFWGKFTPEQISMINKLDEVIQPSDEAVRAIQGRSS